MFNFYFLVAPVDLPKTSSLVDFQILIIRAAKQKGIQVTCEVAPHHLFLCDEHMVQLGDGPAQVRPMLGTREDMEALWENLDIVDCFATDHGRYLLLLRFLAADGTVQTLFD